jgi:hypothetical protein
MRDSQRFEHFIAGCDSSAAAQQYDSAQPVLTGQSRFPSPQSVRQDCAGGVVDARQPAFSTSLQGCDSQPSRSSTIRQVSQPVLTGRSRLQAVSPLVELSMYDSRVLSTTGIATAQR